jgi:hypothetical protein
MVKNIITKILFIATLLMTCPIVNAASMKSLFIEALNNGHSEGVIKDNVADIFKNATSSKEEIHVTIKKTKEYSRGCGRLHVEMKQSGIKDKDGNLTTGEPWFDVSICPDGNPPIETAQEEQLRKNKELNVCSAIVKRGLIDKETGSMHGTMLVRKCPANGKTYWRYTGKCNALKMPEGIATVFPVYNDGDLTFQLVIPAQCINEHNSWDATISEANKNILGKISVVF